MPRPSLRPLVLAAAVTLANAAKPAAVDDTAYLAFARHIAARPADPYGFDFFWYSRPEPAMGILAPPVVPYWLAAGVRLFGEHVGLLKLWLFPFAWLLAWALDGLLRRFARGTERSALPLLMLSPAVLPMVNLMLDVPALALGLAALRVFAAACDRASWRTAAAAGLLAALAMQTKYTMLLTPAVLGWYGLAHRGVRFAALAVAVAGAAFAGWEVLLWAKYGTSHFLFHVTAQAEEGGDVVQDKLGLFAPLVAHLGCLAFGFALYAGRAVWLPRAVVAGFALLWLVGAGLIAVLPHRDTILVSGKEPGTAKLTLAALVWRSAGTVALLTAAACAAVLLVRRAWGLRRNADGLFVVGWVLLELAGYFVLTPFPAARRVLGVALALGLLAARTVSRVSRARPDRQPPPWVVPFGVLTGVLVAALDTFDAHPEKVIAERSATLVSQQRPLTGWYAGHWGFQHYCERAGLRPAIDGGTVIEPGDLLVQPVFPVPVNPDRPGFYRPENYHTPPPPPPWVAEPVAEFTWDDPLSAQTIPNFYGGIDPVIGRDAPRLRVVVFRFTRPWLVGEWTPPGGGWR